MLDWKLPAALTIGFFFVYLSNKKVVKKLTDDYKKEEEK